MGCTEYYVALGAGHRSIPAGNFSQKEEWQSFKYLVVQASILVGGKGLEFDDPWDPLQPKPFDDCMIPWYIIISFMLWKNEYIFPIYNQCFIFPKVEFPTTFLLPFYVHEVSNAHKMLNFLTLVWRLLCIT